MNYLIKYISIFIALITSISCEFKSAEDYLKEAEILENKGQFKDAVKLLNKAIEKDPEYLGAYINRGADKSIMGNYEEAIQDYKKVIDIDSNNTLALFNIGNNYRRLGDYLVAINYYTKSLKTKGSENISVDFVPNKFIDLSQYDVPAHEIKYERGLLYYELDSIKKSLSDFIYCIEKNYMIKESHYMLGALLLKSGDLSNACKEFKISANMGYINAQNMIKQNCSVNQN
jgi:tetratricopeptide (TPR) repeat protein